MSKPSVIFAAFFLLPIHPAFGSGFAGGPVPANATIQNQPPQVPTIDDHSAQLKISENSFVDALTNGTPTLNMRYRFEDVRQDGFSGAANANTLRTRLGYETGVFDDFKGKVQIENLIPIGRDTSYNDDINGLTKYPAIADPRETLGLYEANLSYQGLPQSTILIGREAIVLDNERWIGASDWRQLGQTMDAVTAQNHSIDKVDLTYSYVFHVDRVYGPAAGAGIYNSYDASAHLINASYTVLPGVKFVGYDYLLDLLNARTLSSQTAGGRVEVKQEILPDTNALFYGEYARQFSYADNPLTYAYNYYLVEPGLNLGPFTGKVGYEVMGGDGNHALQAPLDTGHAFNGWAEKFLTTPGTGLDSVHIASEYKSPSYNEWLNSTLVRLIWHDFHANSSNVHYGDEYDAWVSQTFCDHYILGLEYAQFDADQVLKDTRKMVVQFQIKY